MLPLTPYEQQQVREIAGWKAEPPALAVEAMDAVTHPLVRLAERFIPQKAVRDAIELAYRDAEILAHRESVAERAQVADVRELQRADLARCDKLAEEFARISARNAMIRGASATAGPVLSMELAIMYALKTVHTIGFCYGFTPEDPGERAYALGILQMASAGNMQEKQQANSSLNSVKDVLVEELVEEVIESATESVAQQAMEQVAEGSIPFLGVAVQGVTNAATTYFTGYVAKRAFQERWLRANGKVDRIAADPQFARSRLRRAEGVLAGAFYWPSYLVSFAVTYPVYLLASLLPRENAAVAGLIDGGTAASQDVVGLRERIERAFAPSAAELPAPVLLPAPA